MGVDLFFVISGFLITGILLDTKGTEGYFRNFYARRCLRIWPLYYSSLLLMFAVVPLLRPSEAFRIFGSQSMPWWSYVVFLQNFFVPRITRAAGLLAVTWSLAIEEQFYLVWPFVVRYCSPARLRIIAAAVFCFSPALRYYFLLYKFNVYANTLCRLDGLMVGALLASLFRSGTFSPQKYVTLAWIVLLMAAPCALLTDNRIEWAVYSCTALASASFIYLAMFSQRRWLQAVLANRFLIYTGTISYGMYLLQKVSTGTAQVLQLDRHLAIMLPFCTVTTYLMAILSWYLIEKPTQRLKHFFELKRLPRVKPLPVA
jgi:peptidoglycan/LPS O-acetylase OafA/YrhL